MMNVKTDFINVIIPMAGLGSRFIRGGYRKPKPLIDVNGKPMIKAVIESMGITDRAFFHFIVRDYKDSALEYELHKVLKECGVVYTSVILYEETRGAAETCLKVASHIDSNTPLIITNCDQIFTQTLNPFVDYCLSSDHDGVVATYSSIDPKNSFVKLDKYGKAQVFAEKSPISDKALTGLHYWRRGCDFVRSARAMIADDHRENNEYYVAPTYNYLIKEGKFITTFEEDYKSTVLIGTPEDLDAYITSVRLGWSAG